MKTIQKHNVYLFVILALVAIVVFSGCQVGSRPRLRVSDFFGDPGGMRFPDPNNLGHHSLAPSRDEKVGMLYTCNGGFIDMGHLREAADRTEYASGILYSALLRSRTSCTYQIIEPSKYHLTIHYPKLWASFPWKQKKEIARELSIEYGQYLAHTSLIWHETLTWYGFASSGVFSENISAFSWEDPYSDVLGTRLAVLALTNTKGETYEEAMTRLISETLQQLEVQPAEIAKKAEKQIAGDWFEGGYYFFVKMKHRNFDVGFDDGMLTPCLVPGICPDAVPQECPAPDPGAVLEKYGFKMRLQIETLEFQKKKIYHDLDLDSKEYINPATHFPILLDCIIKQAEALKETEFRTDE